MPVPKVVNPLGAPGSITSVDAAVAAYSAAADRMATDEEFRKNMTASVVGNPITVQAVAPASELATKMIQRANAAGEDWVKGMQTPSRDPKAAALAAKGKWKSAVEQAIKDNAFEKGVAGINLDEMIATAIAVGASGFTAGINAREAKIRRRYEQLQPHLVAVKRAIEAMPQDTEAQREDRLRAARRLMIEVGKKLRG